METYHAAVAAAAKGRATRLENLIESNGAYPVEGKGGSLHAPHDGYIWRWWWYDRDGFEVADFEKTAMGGEFLPASRLAPSFEIGPRVSSFGWPSLRIDYVDADMADSIVHALDGILRLRCGKGFEGRSGGLVCHLYVDNSCADAAELVRGHIEAVKDAAYQAEVARRAAVAASAEACPAGRVEVTGTVLSTKWVENKYGSTLKMLVEDRRGFKVFGSVPSALENVRGRSVSFTAALEPSQDDEKFGFFKRPTKATFIDAEAA
jgi:hypothetical protein